MTGTLAAIGAGSALVTVAALIGGIIARMSAREARVDAVLERLVDGFEDHEERLRVAERGGAYVYQAAVPARRGGGQHRRY